jgi:hypothetical protein
MKVHHRDLDGRERTSPCHPETSRHGESWRSMSGLTEKLLRFPRTGRHAAFSSFFWIRATRRAYSTEGTGKIELKAVAVAD